MLKIMQKKCDKPKYVFVTGGVISGVGKGTFTASLACLIEAQGYRVDAIKIDPYVNLDAGTMRPTEHGEVYVTNDGFETDQDLGNYERFSSMITSRNQSITTGQIYLKVIQNERSGKYEGKSVEVVYHTASEVIRRIKEVQNEKSSDFVLIEVGGSVGEYQTFPFLEAARMMKVFGDDVAHIHVGFIPIPAMLGEPKTKPLQESIQKLREICGNPDFVVARCSVALDDVRKQKIALSSGVPVERIISAFDDRLTYRIPLNLASQNLHTQLLYLFGLPYDVNDGMTEWRSLVLRIENISNEITIGMVGKYFDIGNFNLKDSYLSVFEALRHAGWHQDVRIKIEPINAKNFEDGSVDISFLEKFDGVITPGGFGVSGIEGMLSAIRFCRENNIPHLGLCLGLQLEVIEFSRNVLGLSDANSTEVDPNTSHPVIDVIDTQKDFVNNGNIGGTMRLGAYGAVLRKGSIVAKCYNKDEVSERHRHRWEVNNDYLKRLDSKGLLVSGINFENDLVEFVELSKDVHPFFVGTQSHPEFKSRFLFPHPLFLGFVKASIERNNERKV